MDFIQTSSTSAPKGTTRATRPAFSACGVVNCGKGVASKNPVEIESSGVFQCVFLELSKKKTRKGPEENKDLSSLPRFF